MMIAKPLFLITAVALVAAPANAQFGGLKLKVPAMGGGESNSSAASAGDFDAFIAKAQKNTELLWLSYSLLKQAQKGKVDIAALAAQKNELLAIPEPKERGTRMTELLKGDDDSSKLTEQSVADLENNIASQTPAVRAQIGAALINLTIAIPRAISMAKDAPGLIKGLGASPSALAQVGKLKNIASLLGTQLKYTADIAPLLPRLMAAAKVKPVEDAKTSEGVGIPGLS